MSDLFDLMSQIIILGKEPIEVPFFTIWIFIIFVAFSIWWGTRK